MSRLSRRQLAVFAADAIESGVSTQLAQQLGAYLIHHKRADEVSTLISDIEAELADRGTVVADITIARPVAAASRTRLSDYCQNQTQATTVILREHIDESIVGGVIVRIGGRELDASVRSQLKQLKNA